MTVRHAKTVAVTMGILLGSALTLLVLFFVRPNDVEINDWQTVLQSSRFKQPSKSFLNNIQLQNISDLSQFNLDFERNVALHQLLKSANEADLRRFLVECTTLESDRHRTSIENVVIQRLASLNPTAALVAVREELNAREGELISLIYEEWSLADVDAALASVIDLEQSVKKAALQGILSAHHDPTQERVRELVNRLVNEQVATELLGESAANYARADPQAAWSSLVNGGKPSLAQTEYLIRIAAEWLEQDGISVLHKISDSLSDMLVRDTVITSLLHQYINIVDPHTALLETLNLESNIRDLAVQTIAKVWAITDPEQVLASVANLENSQLRNLIQESVLSAWAQNDPHSLLDYLPDLPKNLRALAQEEAMMVIARMEPDRARTLLADLDDENLWDKLAKEIATSWSQHDPHAALDWVLQDQFKTDVQQAETLMIVLDNLANEDPDLAFQTARNQPIVLRGQYYRGMEVTVIQALVESDINKAMDMLSSIRDMGLTVTHAYSEVGRAMVRNGEFVEALKLGERLSERRRMTYNRSLMFQWAMSDPETLFSSLNQLSSERMKEQAAKGLLRYNADTKALSSKQLEYVASYLPDGYVDPYNINWLSSDAASWFDNQVQVIFLDTEDEATKE